jgi:hypothetical protein
VRCIPATVAALTVPCQGPCCQPGHAPPLPPPPAGSEHPEEPPLWGIPVPPAVVGADTQEDTAVALPYSPEGTAFFVRGGLARMAEVLAEENQRLHFNRCMPTAAGSSSVLWCLLGSSIVRWEVVHRSGAGEAVKLCAKAPVALWLLALPDLLQCRQTAEALMSTSCCRFACRPASARVGCCSLACAAVACSACVGGWVPGSS